MSACEPTEFGKLPVPSPRKVPMAEPELALPLSPIAATTSGCASPLRRAASRRPIDESAAVTVVVPLARLVTNPRGDLCVAASSLPS
jgi:hypothetical protein